MVPNATVTGITEYTPSPALEYYGRYYWRVNEVSDGGEVVTDTVWTFKAIYDDTLIVDNDGLHAVIEIDGQIGLEKGLHKIKVHFFENEGGEAFKVQYDGPDINKQEIPEQILKH